MKNFFSLKNIVSYCTFIFITKYYDKTILDGCKFLKLILKKLILNHLNIFLGVEIYNFILFKIFSKTKHCNVSYLIFFTCKIATFSFHIAILIIRNQIN